MQAVNSVSIPKTPSRSILVQNSDNKSDRILRIDSIVAQSWYVLGVALTGAALLARVVTIVFPSSLTFTILAVSIVALTLLTTKVVVGCLEPHLSPRMKEVADYVQATLGDVLLAMSDLFIKPLFICSKFFGKKQKENDDSDTDTVVIHGYNGQSALVSLYIKYRFDLACMGPIHTINLGSQFVNSVEDHAKKLQAYIEKLQKKTGHKKVKLICHSMGGLVAKHYLDNFRSEKVEVTKIVTLGSPLEGTPVAKVAALNPFDKCAKDMSPGSDLLRNLAKKTNAQAQTRFLHIASKNDLIVPVDSALFKSHEGENVERLLVSGVGHCGLPFSDTVIDAMIEFLTSDEVEKSTHKTTLEAVRNIASEAG